MNARTAWVLAIVLALSSWCSRVLAQDTAPFPRTGEYVGAAVCIECHKPQHQRLLRGSHALILQSADLVGCETCHGPGKEHTLAKDNDTARITLPASFAAAAQAEFCGRCHQHEIRHHGGDMAGLQQAGKSCSDCHQVHRKRDAEVLPGVRFGAVAESRTAAQRVGSKACIECHPIRDQLLAQSAHQSLAAHASATGCEDCHGNGDKHIETNGLARLITRPDRSKDGVATCRSCHEKVDAQDFHWAGKSKPYLSAGVTCTTCHTVHKATVTAAAAATPAASGPVTEIPVATNRVCATCHAPASCTMPGSTHASIGTLGTPLERGCASCHEGGLAHAQSGGKKALVQSMREVPAAEQARLCLSCHRDSEKLQHVTQGAHLRHNVGCLECHAPVHGAVPGKVTMKAEENCKRCHADVQAQFALPNHHPVPEGRMQCTSCHDVHGDMARVRNLELTQDRCVQCHKSYQGPFVFAHQASRRDGCIACHLPHGTPNNRLLQQVNTQQNCLQCHGDFPAFHDQTRGAVFTDCLRCHTQVHGSNHSRYLFR